MAMNSCKEIDLDYLKVKYLTGSNEALPVCVVSLNVPLSCYRTEKRRLSKDMALGEPLVRWHFHARPVTVKTKQKCINSSTQTKLLRTFLWENSPLLPRAALPVTV